MKIEIILKYALGIFIILAGLNKFLPIMPGMSLSAEASMFMESLLATGYLMSFVGAIEIISGIMLIGKNTTPLGLILLAPVSANIILFHLFLDPITIWMGLFVAATNFYLMYKNRDFYAPIFLAITNGKKLTKDQLKSCHLSYNS